MTRINHRTRSESEHHVRGPGRKRPSPWTRNGTRITLGLGVWWGRTQGTPEARCRTQHPGDRPGAQRLRRVADPPNAKYLSVMGTAARSHPPVPLEGTGGRSRPVQPASGLPRTRQGGLALAGAAGQVPHIPARARRPAGPRGSRRPTRVLGLPPAHAGVPFPPRSGEAESGSRPGAKPSPATRPVAAAPQEDGSAAPLRQSPGLPRSGLSRSAGPPAISGRRGPRTGHPSPGKRP